MPPDTPENTPDTTPDTAAPSGPRKRSARKREAILSAAMELFCSEGVGASVESIAARAGVSKATVYAHFASKEDLFKAIIASVAETYIKLPPSLVDAPPEQGLRELARRFLAMILDPEKLATFRALISEGRNFPEMAEAFHASGPRRVVAAVADYFRIQTERGRLNVPDPDLTATLFLSMVKGEPHMHALLGLTENCTDPDRIIDEVVRIILAAYGTGR